MLARREEDGRTLLAALLTPHSGSPNLDTGTIWVAFRVLRSRESTAKGNGEEDDEGWAVSRRKEVRSIEGVFCFF